MWFPLNIRGRDWRFQLGGLFALALGASVLFQLLFVLPRIRNRDLLASQMQQKSKAQEVADVATRVLAAAEDALVERTATLDDLADAPAGPLDQDFEDRVMAVPNLLAAAWFDGQGRLRARTESVVPGVTAAGNVEPQLEALRQGHTWFGPGTARSAVPNLAVVIAVPVPPANGDPPGVLCGFVGLPRLVEAFRDGAFDTGQSAALLAPDGALLMRGGDESGSDAFAGTQWLNATADDDDDDETASTLSDIYADEEVLGAYARSLPAGWTVVVERRRAAALKGTRAFLSQLALVDLGAFAAALALGLIVIREITAQRKQSEEELRRSEVRYRNVFESLLDIYFETNDQDCLTELSPSIQALTGYTRAELLDQPADRVFRGAELWTRMRAALAAGEQVRDWEIEVLTNDDRVEVGSLNATAVLDGGAVGSRIRGTVRLISDRKRAEQLLRQSEETSRALLNASFSYALLLDRHMRILAANESLEKAVGAAPAGLTGTSTTDLVGGPLRGFRHSRALEVFYTGEPARFEEATGAECQEYSLFPVFGTEGRVESIALLVRDISEQKRLEARLREAAKMDAVGQLAGGIAHDFNNLLTGVHGGAEMLLRKLPEDDPCRRYADRIRSAAARAADLTDHLVSLSRSSRIRSEPVDVHQLIDDTISFAGHGVTGRIDVTVIKDATRTAAYADPGELQNALLNIVLNARDAMPGGGTLTVRTRNLYLRAEDAPPGFEIKEGWYIGISLSDTGVGMDEKTLGRVFEPFFTTKPRGRGTGLGLASVYVTIKNHGGALRVSSVPGEGAEFDVLLPCSPTPVVTTEVPAPPTAAPASGSGLALVVDDEEIVRETAADALEALGFEVTAVPSGSEAVRRCQASGRLVTVAFIDAVMPGMSGGEAARALRAVQPGMRVIIASGMAPESEVRNLCGEDGCSFVRKPITFESLTAALQEAGCVESPLPTPD